MTEFLIKNEDLTGIKDKVVVVTGGSSGIGLATINLALSLGAKAVSADITPPPTIPTSNFLFVKADVSIWTDLTSLFKQAKEKFGRIDYVFANAGISPRANYLRLNLLEDGELMEPNYDLIDIMLRGVMNTATLGVHYMKQQPEGGAIVLMGSSTSLQPMRAPDYCTYPPFSQLKNTTPISTKPTTKPTTLTSPTATSKAGTLAFGRGLALLTSLSSLPIRVNTLLPSWTTTNLLPSFSAIMEGVKHRSQDSSLVAKCAIHLFLDANRNGEGVFVADGRFVEVDKAILQPAYERIKGEGPSDDEIFGRILALGE
ncbi:levodione reductase [Venturia nashicola]|uniref:Levodione reductase n=1 Tax=Venturia nashicola TaxID=86259 RepID=A0A4Z1PC60_9PEZI|nr:levodione reductase [Venturia nashicola]